MTAASSCSATLLQHRSQVLSRYRELLRLIRRLPEPGRAAAAAREAREAMRAQQQLQDPQARLDALKQLVSRIGFLRITTPRRPGEGLSGGGGTFVLRNGQLVEGAGADKGSRVADGALSFNEAKAKNKEHYKRFYGKPMPDKMFF